MHRLPRLQTMQLAHHPPRFPRGHQGPQGLAGRAGLRRQHHGHPPGDALVRLRPVPRRVLLQGPEKRLTYPWHKGLKVENIYEYYEEVGFTDWTHAKTGAPTLKAQHPEFEMWNQGVHARSGVACADCHMPYTRVGAMKISDHHVRSPLLNINNSCQTCHRFSGGRDTCPCREHPGENRGPAQRGHGRGDSPHRGH
jgi:hypothetical protein